MEPPYLVGTLEDDTGWEVGVAKKNVFLTVFNSSGKRAYREKVSKLQVRAFMDNRSLGELFFQSYVEARMLDRAMKKYARDYYGFTKITDAKEESLRAIADPTDRLRCFELLHGVPGLASDELERVSGIMKMSEEAGSKISVYFIEALKFKKNTVSEALDLLDFLIHGKDGETFKEFLALFAGRVYQIEKTNATAIATVAGDTHSTRINYVVDDYFRLQKRSATLAKELENYTASQLFNALSRGVPHDLTVDGCLLLCRALKDNAVGGSSNYFSAALNVKLNREQLEQRWGSKAGASIAEAKLSMALEECAVGKTLNMNGGVLKQSALYSYAVVELGAEQAVAMLRELAASEAKLAPRTYVELVKRGGFAKDEVPAWVLAIL